MRELIADSSSDSFNSSLASFEKMRDLESYSYDSIEKLSF